MVTPKNLNSPREISIKSAIAELEKGLHANIKDAARAHGIPYTTLYFRVKGRKTKEPNHSHHQEELLSHSEEILLVRYVSTLSSGGYPCTFRHLYELVKEIIGKRIVKDGSYMISPTMSQLSSPRNSYGGNGALPPTYSNGYGNGYNVATNEYSNNYSNNYDLAGGYPNYNGNNQFYSNPTTLPTTNGRANGYGLAPAFDDLHMHSQPQGNVLTNELSTTFSDPNLVHVHSPNNLNNYRIVDINDNGHIINHGSKGSLFEKTGPTTMPDYKTCKAWLQRFLKRHPELPSDLCQPIDKNKTGAYLDTALKRWFKGYENLVTRYQITQDNVYNVDETGFILGETQRRWAIIDSTVKVKHHREDIITELECVCGDKTFLNPYIVFKGRCIDRNWFPYDTDESWQFICSESGWTSSHILYDWLVNSFDRSTRIKAGHKTRLLIFNGHPTHITGNFLDFCTSHNIELLILPPSTSQILQPLDLTIFGPLKYRMAYEMDELLALGIPRVLKQEWIGCLKKARNFALTRENIENGFRKAGLIPFAPFY